MRQANRMRCERQVCRTSVASARLVARRQWPFGHGLTLIELMIVVAILAVLASLAAPNFHEFVTRRRLDSAVQEVLVSLQFARSEAIRRGRQITLRLAAAAGSANWGSGWTMFVDDDGDGTLDAGEEVVRTGMALTPPLTLMGSASVGTLIAFSREGRLTNDAGGVFVLCQGGTLTDGSGNSRSRAVLVNGAGRVRLAQSNASNVPVTDTGTVGSCTNP